MFKIAVILTIAMVTASRTPSPIDYTGTYRITGEGVSVVVTLQQHPDGSVGGQLTSNAISLTVSGAIEAPGISGTVAEGGYRLGFVAELCEKGDHLSLKLFEFDASGRPDYESAQVLMLERVVGAADAAPSTINAGAREAVIVNRQPVTAQVQASIERQYGTRIPSGRYWYDARSGAWGAEGGPTAGFTIAGLNLPGPMPADVSGGGTSIFVNGREIHSADQVALHQLLGVTYPGRYWLDAQGNLGIEGGPALVNLARSAQQRAGSQYGSVYSEVGGTRRTLASDGSGGYMFMSSDGTSYFTGQ